MLLIYTPIITPRISYIMQIMVGDLLQSEYSITDDLVAFQQYEGVKFSYGNEAIEGLHFDSVGLLQEIGVTSQDLSVVTWQGYNLFFPVSKGALSFDPFAVAFYLITRYEEYDLETPKDEHGRYMVAESIAYKNGFHRKPMINIIACEIGKMLKAFSPDYVLPKPSFTILRSYDVDIAYQYKGKTVVRFVGSLVKSLLQFDFQKVGKLILTLLGKEVADDFDTFALYRQRALSEQQTPIHFILTAPFGKFDRNISYKSKAFKRLIQYLSEFSEIGLHPSYSSSRALSLIGEEKQRLEKVFGNKVVKSRQHFLRFTFPNTFNQLIAEGFTDDYSLGWTNEAGFRASITIPFPFYDLHKEQKTSLILHSLHTMDAALARLTSSEEEQKRIINDLIAAVEQYGGEMVMLEHNSF